MTQPRPKDAERLLAIDVCGTLYPDNTTAGLIRVHHDRQRNRIRGAIVRLAGTRRLPFTFGFTILSRLTGIDLHRLLVVRSLRGERRDTIQASARAYVAILETRRIEEVFETVAELRARGWTPILVSNSVAPIIEEIGAAMNIPVLASELEWTGDLCAGGIAKDLTGRKRTALEALVGHPLELSQTKVITDNRSDNDLVMASAEPIIVLHRGHSNWTGRHDVRIIRP